MCVCCRNWEALKRWDDALQLTPDDAVLYEMKSQVKTKNCLVYAQYKIDGKW